MHGAHDLITPLARSLAQAEAQAALSYALQHCHRGAPANKALVLKYLVPVSWRDYFGTSRLLAVERLGREMRGALA